MTREIGHCAWWSIARVLEVCELEICACGRGPQARDKVLIDRLFAQSYVRGDVVVLATAGL